MLHNSTYYRRSQCYSPLVPLAALLSVFTVVWSVVVVGLGLLLGGGRLIWQGAFVQNVVASLLVLPISLAIGVVVGTLLEKHSLCFKVRYASDKLGDCVRLATFKLILFLRNECKLPIDIEGPINYRFVERARTAVQREFVASAWKFWLPPALAPALDDTVEALLKCFMRLPELQIAFPRSFELMDKLGSLMASIKTGASQSSPGNTALIVLHYTAEMLNDLE